MQGPFEASSLEIFKCSDENFLVSATTENGAGASPNEMFHSVHFKYNVLRSLYSYHNILLQKNQ